MPRRLIALGVAAAIAVGLAGASASAPPARLDHVFVIMLENHSQHDVIGNPNAPFITALARKYGRATGYLGVTHPSQPNYVALFSGSNWWMNSDSPDNRYNHSNLVDQLEAHHLTWAAYMESMPSVGYLGPFYPPETGLYVNRHNPFILFRDIRGNPARRSHIKPYGGFAADMRRSRVPSLVWISPNLCDDMHGGPPACPKGYDDPNDARLKRNADVFVKRAVGMIMRSAAWRQPSAIFILTDESTETNLNPVAGGYESAAACCDSPIVPPGFPWAAWKGGTLGGGSAVAVIVANWGKRHFVSPRPYNHYSVLATIEANWGLGYLGNAGDRAQVPLMNAFLRR